MADDGADNPRGADLTSEEDREEAAGELRMPLATHLIELRRRLVICVLAFVAFFSGTLFLLYGRLYSFIHWPLARANSWLPVDRKVDTSLLALGPTDPIVVAMKLGVFAALVLASPVILYEVWAFMRPGLTPRERRAVWPIVVGAPLCFILGGCFGYLVLLPIMSYCLIMLTPMPDVVPHWAIDRMANYVLTVTAACGAIFELPIVVSILSLLGLVTPRLLTRIRKYVILGAFVLAALMTPGPDVFSQCLEAIPIVILYEISILISKVIYRGKKRRQAEQEAEDRREEQEE